jgi:hypothetical protein
LGAHYDLFGNSTLQWKLALVGAVIGLTIVHLRKPKLHALQAAILGVTLVIVWLGPELASPEHGLGRAAVPRLLR